MNATAKKRTVALVVGLIVVLTIVIVAHVRARKSEEKSLYDRLGGIYPIAAVVNDFSDALIVNPVVGKESKNQYLNDWSNNKLVRLPGLKLMRTIWLASLAGGPFKFSPTKPGKCPFSLENAHMGFQISPEEFDAVAAELGRSLDKFKVGAKEKAEVLAVFSAHKPDVVRGYDMANHLPFSASAIKCPFLSKLRLRFSQKA